MAVKAMRPCARPGCAALTCGTYCQAHQPKDGGRRRVEWRGWYTGGQFRKARAEFMAEHPFCTVCGARSTDLDHIRPHKGNPELFWDSDNWQALCAGCHSRKTAAEDGGFGNTRRGNGERSPSGCRW